MCHSQRGCAASSILHGFFDEVRVFVIQSREISFRWKRLPSQCLWWAKCSSAPAQSSKRQPSLSTPVEPPDGPGYCTSSTQINCVDPASNLYVIGSVQARTASYSVQTSWSVSGDGSDPDYFGSLHRFTNKLAVCSADRTAELAATAYAMATYIRDNAATLVSATSDLRTYVGVYLIGGASSFELICAVGAVLTIGDWVLLLASIGLVGYEVGSLIKCVASQNA
jgi:hypothetical protein